VQRGRLLTLLILLTLLTLLTLLRLLRLLIPLSLLIPLTPLSLLIPLTPLIPLTQIDPRYKKLAELVCDEAGFLVDAKVQRLMENATKEEGKLIKVENVMKALGVVDGPTFDR
jgi:hypothetical protein